MGFELRLAFASRMVWIAAPLVYSISLLLDQRPFLEFLYQLKIHKPHPWNYYSYDQWYDTFLECIYEQCHLRSLQIRLLEVMFIPFKFFRLVFHMEFLMDDRGRFLHRNSITCRIQLMKSDKLHLFVDR